MRRWSWAGVALAAWVLATLQLPAPAAAATANATFTEVSYNITALPETCGYLRKDFGSKYVEYQASWSSNATIPEGCTLEISKLYMEGTCSFARKWSNACPRGGSGRFVGGSNASCEAVLHGDEPSLWSTLSPKAIGKPATFDADTSCAASPIGYFYIHNSCNQALSFAVTIRYQSLSSCPVPWYWQWYMVLLLPLAVVGLLFVANVVIHTCVSRTEQYDGCQATRAREVPLAPVVADEAPPSPAPDAEPSSERTPLLVVGAPATPTPRALPAAHQAPGHGLDV